MNAKIVVAILAVSILSVALAFGITFVVQSSIGQPVGVSLPTPTNGVASFTSAPTSAPISSVGTDAVLSGSNCTFSIDEWLKYKDTWPFLSYPIGSQTYTREQIIAQITAETAGPRENLLAQSIAVVLNQQIGADVTTIRNSFSASISLLVKYSQGSVIKETDLRKIQTLLQDLTLFNQGESGPPACGYALSEVKLASLPTRPMIATSTPTPRPTVVYLPTWTQPPSPQPQEPAPTRRPPAPTSPPPPPPQPTDPPPPPATEAPPDPEPTEPSTP